MTRITREERLRADHESMRALQRDSTIFQFEALGGEPPDRYAITFHGRGMYRENRASANVIWLDAHRCEIRLPYSYPDRPPDVRWQSQVFHPNISFSGFINFREIGLTWEPRIGLDQICERLWDIARLEFINLERATNYAARNWFQSQTELQLPLDARPLRDKLHRGSNVVRYQRRGASGGPSPGEPPVVEVLYIGEETASPPPRRQTPRDDEDDVLFIGD